MTSPDPNSSSNPPILDGGPVPQYPPYISERQMDTTHLPQSTLEKLHGDDGVVLRKPGELGPAPTAHGPLMVESPPGSGVWVPDHRPLAPGSVLPAGNRSGGETYPTTGDPAVDEAIRQTVSNLVDIRDAHGTGQSPVGGGFFSDGATKVQGIQQNIQEIGRGAQSRWVGDSGDLYQQINRKLAT